MSRQQSCHINYKSKLHEGGVGGGGQGEGYDYFLWQESLCTGKGTL